MENVGKVTTFILFFISAFFVSVLGAYVILKIAHIYDLKFVTQFTFAQIYGVMCVFSVLKHVPDEDKKGTGEKKSFNKILGEGVLKLSGVVSFYLFSWFVAYIMYLILS